MTFTAPKRTHDLREVFNALRWMVRAGAPWRYMPQHFPPWNVVYKQTQRWIAAGVFGQIVHDLREVLRLRTGRCAQPTAAIMDGRTMRSSCESGPRAGYDGAKKTRGTKVHLAVDTLGHLLALHVTPANEGEREQVAQLAAEIQEVTVESVKVAYADQGYTGEQPRADAAASGIELQIVRLPEAKKGFVLLPKRWIVERSIAWAARFRRLSRDYERLPQTVAGFHYLAFAFLMIQKAFSLQ